MLGQLYAIKNQLKALNLSRPFHEWKPPILLPRTQVLYDIKGRPDPGPLEVRRLDLATHTAGEVLGDG